jgi:hypothetical protein
MGTRGPIPQPLRLKLLKGNSSHRPIDLDVEFQPATTPDTPEPPPYLTGPGLEEWNRIAPEPPWRYSVIEPLHSNTSVICSAAWLISN